METRSKRRQQEVESAVSEAPVIQTRAQKAARIASQPQNTSPAVPLERKRKQTEQVEPSNRPQRKRPRAAETQGASKESKEPGSQHQKASPRLRKDQEAKPSASAEKGEMDRHRRDARKELEEAARLEQEELEEAGDLFGRGLANNSTLQGLLRTLGVHPGALGGGQTGMKIKAILTQLKSEDEIMQLDGLNELNNFLSVSMEDALASCPVEQLVPVLISLLQTDHNPDIMLLAARSLTHLADNLPTSCSSIVRHGGVPALCERLLNIEYIDLAEQSLQALEKLSSEHAQACLRSGALLAVLSYLDFFQTSVQRVAVATAAHMCRGVTRENTDAINSAVPILTNLLQYQDAKVVENASLALTRIAEALANSPVQMEALCNQGLISNAMQLVAVSEGGSMTSQLAVSTYYGLIKLLRACAGGSPAVAETLHQAGISNTIRKLLSSSPLFSSSTTSSSSVLRSSDQLKEVISLTQVLLPPIVPSVTLITQDQPTVAELVGGSDQVGQVEDVTARRSFLVENPGVLQEFGSNLLQLMLNVYNGTVVQQVKDGSLSTVTKILQYSPPEMLRGLLQNVAISSFIASLLVSREPATLAVAVRLAELLMLKLPDLFTPMFLKEGVFFAMEQLANEAPAAPQPAPGKKNKRSSSRLKNKGKDKGDSKGSSPVPPAPIAAPTPPTTPGQTLRLAAAARAQKFLKAQFGASSAGRGAQTEGAKLLREICGDLGQAGAVARLLEVLRENGGAEVSTFEFLSSGAVQSLRKYLLGEDLSALERPTQLLGRLNQFAEEVSKSRSKSGILALIRKLQDGLAAAENLAVYTSQMPSSASLRLSSAAAYGGFGGHRPAADSSNLNSGLAALTTPFKLNLARAPHEEQLRSYAMNSVLIEPLASMAAVEDFLWPRVQRSAEEAAKEAAVVAKAAAAATRAEDKRKGQAELQQEKEREKKAKGASPRSKAQEQKKGAGEEDAALKWEASGGRQARRPASKVQPIPGAPQEAEAGAPQPRLTRAQAIKAAAQAKEAEEHAGGGDTDGTSPSDGGADPMILLHGGEVEVEGDGMEDDEEDDEDEQMQYDDDEDEDMDDDMDEDGGLGLDQLQVHTVDLGDENAQPANADPPPAQPATTAATAAQPSGGGGGQATAGQSYAQAAAAAGGAAAAPRQPGQPCTNLIFYADGQPLPGTYTIFQAVTAIQQAKARQQGAQEGDAVAQMRQKRMWDETHVLQYSRIENPAPATKVECKEEAVAVKEEGAGGEGAGAPAESPLQEVLHIQLPPDLEAPQQVKDVLLLLKVLECLNRVSGQLARYEDGKKGKTKQTHLHAIAAREDFISHKLTPKLAQQLKDVLAICGGNMPHWVGQLVFDCKFLFPFDLRRRYFYCTSSGLARALQHLQQQQAAEGHTSTSQERELRVSRIQRQKVRISRKRILESAIKVMESYAGNRTVIELEYFNEAGTGLGPTLEFYTLLSHELQKKGLGMWRFDDPASEKAAASVTKKHDEGAVVTLQAALPDKAHGQPNAYVVAPQGLFPAPLHSSEEAKVAKVVEYFKLLGRAMAKALQDNRLLDIPLSYVFYRCALKTPLGLYNVREVDSSLGATLETLQASHAAWLQGDPAQPMLVDGANIDDLCLTFELPGHPQYELIPGGSDMEVTAANAGEYIAAVVNATLSEGIEKQMEAFRAGFEEVLPLDTLGCFYEEELEAMLCGQGEKWTVDLLTDALKFDHGYTSSSTAIRYFLEILSAMDAGDQRRFLRFVTGSPRLRPGGLSALHPRLTVVRKHASSQSSDPQLGSSAGSLPGSLSRSDSRLNSAVDGDLPSVMTCANYLKLPPYSSKAVMQARLLFAIREGQGSFDLS